MKAIFKYFYLVPGEMKATFKNFYLVPGAGKAHSQYYEVSGISNSAYRRGGRG